MDARVARVLLADEHALKAVDCRVCSGIAHEETCTQMQRDRVCVREM